MAAEPTAEEMAAAPFLPRLTDRFTRLQRDTQIQTAGFCEAMALILPVFDHLGMFFHFAKHEMSGKVDTLVKAQTQQPTLNEVVSVCKKEGSVTTKNSTARNLHRLLSAVEFIKILMANLAQDPKMTLHNACYDAYNRTMSQIHTFVVRTAVKAGMYTLPTRENFLKSLGEAGPAAKGHADTFVQTAEALHRHCLTLFEGTSMPRSDSTFVG